MAFFDNLTISLQQKWLQFFQDNHSWITLQMQVESVYTPDGGRRPSAYLILGAVSVLEPQLAELMVPFSKLNPDADALISVLELNFDPDLALGNRFTPNDIMMAADELSDLSLSEMADAVVLIESDDESIVMLSPAEAEMLGDMSLDELADAMGLTSDEELLESTVPNDDLEPSATDAEQGDVLSDVWAEGTNSEPESAAQQSESDKDISRLFPNS